MLAPASQEDIDEVEKNKNFKIGDKRNSFPSIDSFHFIGPWIWTFTWTWV